MTTTNGTTSQLAPEEIHAIFHGAAAQLAFAEHGLRFLGMIRDAAGDGSGLSCLSD